MKPAMAFQILVVEDNPLDVELVCEAVSTWKTPPRVFAVPDGVSALQYLRKEGPYRDATAPNLILLDLNLPKMNGMDVLEQIKKDPRFALIPVIVLTTSDREADVRSAYGLHANSYMTKPLEIDEFFKKVQAIEIFWYEHSRLPQLPVAPTGVQ